MSNGAVALSEDKKILRELAKRKYEIGCQPIQAEKAKMWTALNDLKPVRPMVWINELPWHELSAAAPGELASRCSDGFLAGIEQELRMELYQWDHFACDMVVEPVIFCDIVGGPRGSYADYGIQEKNIRKEGAHDVLFEPIINTMEDAEKIRTPEVWYDKEESQRRFHLLQEVFDGVIPVKRQGIVHQWHTPWDQAVHWYSVERLMYDMIDKPEVVARVAERMVKAANEVIDRQIELGMLDVGSGNWRVGSGGMGYSSELPSSVEGRPVTPADQWGCGNAQIFSEVSPEMHEEFSLRFERPFMERFGLSYYGCCEPLHRKIDMLRSIKNLRKISMSPKADLRVAVESCAGDYVLSFKPNPAYLAPDAFSSANVRDDLCRSLDLLEGAPSEVILKDVTTIRSDPSRLEQWAEEAMRAVER